MPKSTEKQNTADPKKIMERPRRYSPRLYEQDVKEFKYFNPKPGERPKASAMFHAIALASESFEHNSDESARLMCRAILLMDLAHHCSVPMQGDELFKVVSTQLDAMERNILKAGAR